MYEVSIYVITAEQTEKQISEVKYVSNYYDEIIIMLYVNFCF